MKESMCLFDCKINNSTYLSKQQSSPSSSRIKRTSSTRFSPWKQIKTSSFQTRCRSHHGSVLKQNKLFVFGGFDNDYGILDDFKMFQITNDSVQSQQNQKGKWTNLPIEGGPGPRHSHTAILYDDCIYIFGGKVDQFKNCSTLNSFSIKENKWYIVQTFESQEEKLNKKEQNVVIVQYSSLRQNRSYKNDQKIKTQQKMTFKYKTKPEGIDSHQAVLIGDQMIIYGGFTNNRFTNNVYSLNLKTKIWKKIYTDVSQSQYQEYDGHQYPQPRGDFSMVEYKNKLYIYGGKNLHKIFNDFWEFNLETLKFRKLDKKTNVKMENRSGHSAIIYGDSMLIFGGIQSVTHERNDLICYYFLGESWTVIWNNSSLKRIFSGNKLNKSKSKKISHSKCKSIENKFDKTENKNEKKISQKVVKYRKPLAQQKKNNNKKQQKTQKQRNKKQNERKINLLNQIQTAIKPYQHLHCQQYSPLIESLNNSIIITSSSYQSSINSKDINYNAGTSPGFNGQGKELKNFRPSQNQKQYFKLKKPKPRDGHTAHLYQSYMVIFGGDRHRIALNSVVFVNLPIILEQKYRVPLNCSQFLPVLLNNQNVLS